MPKPDNAKLNDEQRAFVVQALACFDSPGVVAEAIRKEYGVAITPQSVEGYDPTKRAGDKLAKKWADLFDVTRKTFLEDTARIGISHRAVRLRALQRYADKAEGMGNIALAAQLLEQAAKETGGLYTNRRELSGPGGKPVEMITREMTPKEAAERYRDELG